MSANKLTFLRWNNFELSLHGWVATAASLTFAALVLGAILAAVSK